MADNTSASLALVGLVVQARHAAWDAAAKPETSHTHDQADQPGHVGECGVHMSHAVVAAPVALNQHWEWGPYCGVGWRQSNNGDGLSVHSHSHLNVWILV